MKYGKTIKVLAIGGIVGPILFTLSSLTSASLRADYSHLHSFISELGATGTPNNMLMNFGGFILCGLLFCCFAIALISKVTKGFTAKLGGILILIFGIGMSFAGVFSCDPGCPEIGSTESIIHDRVSAITFFSAIIGTVLLGISFRKISILKSISSYTIFSGILSTVLLILMINSFESRDFTGLWQRLLLLSIFIWTTLVAYHIYKAPVD